MFQKKSIQKVLSEAESGTQLTRTLGPLDVVLLGVGGIIGAGIFVLTGQAAANCAGPAIVISFIISGLGCAFAALCYAELCSIIPVAGSAYTYAYATFGELIAWIIGWDLILEYLFGGATVAVGWSGYVVRFLSDFGIHIPATLAQAPYNYVQGQGWVATGSLINLPAVLIVIACTLLLIRGTKESSSFNNFAVTIKLVVILAFVFLGFSYIKPENYQPFIPPNNGAFGEFGWSGIFRGAGEIFFAYIGFDCLSTLSQEAKNPQRTMPIGILGSLAIVTVLYILVSFVMTGMVNYTKLNDPAPIAVAVDAAGTSLQWLRPWIKIGAIAGLSSVVLVLLMGQPRIFYAMASDGLLPPVFAKIHPKYRTPYIGTYLSGALAVLVAGFLPIDILGKLVSIGTLLAFVIVCAGVWILRYTQPNLERRFKTPWVPLVPILGILVSLAQMIPLPIDTWIRLIVWMGIGIAIYFLYGRTHSKLFKG